MSDGRKLKIYIDLDGVLCDFVSAAHRAHGRAYAGEVLQWNFFRDWHINAGQFWFPIDNQGDDFWADLEPYPWTYEVRDLVARYDQEYRVATSPSEHHTSPAGKVKWIRKHLPGVTAKRRHLSGSKAELAKNGRVLIDDSLANCRDWVAGGGHAIPFPAPHNGLRVADDDILAYLDGELKSCRDAILRQRQARRQEARKR